MNERTRISRSAKFTRGAVCAVAVLAISVAAPAAAGAQSIDAASMMEKTVGAAHDGNGWILWSNGQLGTWIRVSAAGAVTVNVRAAGQPAEGGLPEMKLSVAGRERSWTVADTGAPWTVYNDHVAVFDFTAGTYFVKVEFTNDAYNPPEDRNLYVKSVSFGGSGVSIVNEPDPAVVVDAAAGVGINSAIRGQNTRCYVEEPLRGKQLEVCSNVGLLRGVAGGLDADTYNWKTLEGFGVGPRSTLDLLREARDRNSGLLITANVRGIGVGKLDGFRYTDCSAATLAALAGDWVYYVNHVLPNYRQGDALPARAAAIVNAVQWSGDRLLAPGEAGVPKVTFWEIGNEPELAIGSMPHYSPAEYAARYKAITAAMTAVDPTIKVGPCYTTVGDGGNPYVDAILSDSAARVDFIGYHPYGPLWWIVSGDNGWAQDGSPSVLTPAQMKGGLDWMKTQQVHEKRKIVDLLAAYGRPLNTPLVASEWNPSSWQGNYYYGLHQTAAQGLGTAETLFTFSELGLAGAAFWDNPAIPGLFPESPCYKMFEAMQDYLGNRLVHSYVGRDVRVYVTFDDRAQRLVVWALNFSDTDGKTLSLQLRNLPGVAGSILERRLAADGDTSLITRNDPSDSFERIDWRTADKTGQINMGGFAYTFEDAEATMLVIDLQPAVPSDYDGDGRADLAVYNTGAWSIATSSSNYRSGLNHAWGVPGDIPVPADYDGDGRTEVAVFRPSDGTWHLFNGQRVIWWGLTGDYPVAEDFDGDGKADLGVYRPSIGAWYVLKSSGNYVYDASNWGLYPENYFGVYWGLPGDVPIARDFDGDGKADICVYRPNESAWFVLKSSGNYMYDASDWDRFRDNYFGVWWGLAGDKPIDRDFDGDGRADITVFRPSNNGWYVLKSSKNYVFNPNDWSQHTDSFIVFYLGSQSDDMPLAADIDGDGQMDGGIYSPGNPSSWQFMMSGGNYQTVWSFNWGTAADQVAGCVEYGCSAVNSKSMASDPVLPAGSHMRASDVAAVIGADDGGMMSPEEMAAVVSGEAPAQTAVEFDTDPAPVSAVGGGIGSGGSCSAGAVRGGLAPTLPALVILALLAAGSRRRAW